MLCYYEQLEYILSYNYNGVKMLVPNGRHKIPLMFFPAHGKHLNIPWSAVEEYGQNVIVRYPDGEESPEYQYIRCDCEQDAQRPTVLLCNPNALNYEQMVNYFHNYWLKYFMSTGNNVVIWNY